jgi:preprotein translocase subunit SecF
LPALLLLISLTYLGYFYYQNKDIARRDISLTGGTSITVQDSVNIEELKQEISKTLPDFSIREISDLRTRETIAFTLETTSSVEQAKQALENYLGYELTEENSSTEFTGSNLSQGFYIQLIKSVFIAFILMALVVFIIFGENKFMKVISIILSLSTIKLTFPSLTFVNILIIFSAILAGIYSLYISKTKRQYIYSLSSLLIFIFIFIFPIYFLIFLIFLILLLIYFSFSIPSMAVILSAFADITMTFALFNFLGWKLSSAAIIAFLMLIGYSVDTDIMLTTRIIKRREGEVNSRLFSSFKTGTTMTLTSLAAVIMALIITSGFSEVLKQIFSVLTIGLSFDLINTWITNASLLKWYVEGKS